MQQQEKEHNTACYTRGEITQICSWPNSLIALKEPVYILNNIKILKYKLNMHMHKIEYKKV